MCVYPTRVPIGGVVTDSRVREDGDLSHRKCTAKEEEGKVHEAGSASTLDSLLYKPKDQR